ncbi:mRNA-decapping enzyme subunit 1 [Skeletonema marinoi]|uniref:mRNA-decapping enzyme subunit 1 n=1 Tax=Skeletonema marinoi TaxID=267567 RepID=A0AAD9D4T9_9STRA|nr:mRNA-decapping enzyme subunit 1 [Skeletonema marinoi]
MATSRSSSSTNLAEARRTANLRVLQRLDPQIVDLAITASHVVLYQFSLETQQWIKRNVEGSLFVVKRSDVPRFKLIVSNRNSTENLEVGITSTFQMQLREPYLIFRDSASSNNSSGGGGGGAADEAIRGLWFHDGKEREQVHSYLENVVKSLQKIDEMEKEHGPPPSLMTNTTDNGSNDTSSNASAAAGEKKKGPVEVNTNAAGAALLSTLNLNDNKQPTTTAAKSRKQTPQPLQPTTQSSNTTPSSTSPPPPAAVPANTLDKKSLQLALLSLIQDERFLDLIHAQYLKVASSRAQREQQQQQQNNSNGQGDDK